MNEWYYEQNGERMGPVSEAVILSLRNSEIISDETLVWRQGLEDWLRLGATELASKTSPYSPSAAVQVADESGESPLASKVIFWHKMYCIAFALMYLLLAVAGFFMLIAGEFEPDLDEPDIKILGVIYGVMGAIFTVPFAIYLFLKPGPGVWIYGLVLICIGFTSICCLPASIPLLIFWLKPEVKKRFGRLV
jgi:hypothetical protein